MNKRQIKNGLVGSAIVLITLGAYQNCSPVAFDKASLASQTPSSIQIDTALVSPETPVVSPEPTVTVPDPVVKPPAVVTKISCTASSLPSGKPTGFTYNAANAACMPSGRGPNYQFNILCDTDLPSQPAGLRIQYQPNYFSAITNSRYYLKDALSYYVGRSFYKPAYAPTSNQSVVYELTNIQKTGARSVSVQADFFFLNGFPVDASSQSCNNLRNWNLNLYVYIDKNGQPELFNTVPAQINLQ